MAQVFSYDFAKLDNGYPKVDNGFAVHLVEFFGGGDTPEVRNALLSLQRILVEEEGVTDTDAGKDLDTEVHVDPIPFAHVFEDIGETPHLTYDFAKSLTTFLAGGNTPQLRDWLMNLEKTAKKNNERKD